ncbi:MAG: S8 family serine peptidase [Pseudomonadota bacterium]
MKNFFTTKAKRAGVRIVFTAIACVYFASGCGSSSQIVPTNEVAADLGKLSVEEEVVFTDAYAGYLVMFLQANARSNKSVIASAAKQSSTQNNSLNLPSEISAVINTHPSTNIRRALTISEEKADQLRAELQWLSGKQLQDLNLIYYVDVADPNEAVRVWRELRQNSDVEKVYPQRLTVPASISAVADLTGQQGYLGATAGGLNAEAAWARGVTGEGVVVMDSEEAWNIRHEDLPLDYLPDDRFSSSMWWPPTFPTISADMTHGTAVVGIISSLNNGYGTTGMAYDSELWLQIGSPSLSYLDGRGTDIPGGSVILLEHQIPGAESDSTPCSEPTTACQYGYIPFEADPLIFDLVEYFTAAGMTVISPAANGSVSLADAAVYPAGYENLSLSDSGSILVGASQGSSMAKASFSNFGSPVETFAWGAGVVTTSAPYVTPGIYDWDESGGVATPSTDPNSYFTNRFGGTSAAAPMVASAAALAQSYVKDLLAHGDTRYLMPDTIKEILVTTGRAQTDFTGHNIGRQPRIDLALDEVEDFIDDITRTYPQLTTGARLTLEQVRALRTAGVGIICKNGDPENSDPICPDDGIWIPGTQIAKALDFDGDGRADLVSWTKGQWKLDLSSIAVESITGDDNFGAWDVIINYPSIDSRWVWPYVEDYNSDGREDLAVYDKEHGTWYIAFTTGSLLGTGMWQGWDLVIDHSRYWVDTLEMDPWESQYSRPAPGDYDGDGLIDLAIACSDGIWRIDYGEGPEAENYGYGNFEGKINPRGNFAQGEVRYLSDAQLAAAPGWAYLPIGSPYSRNFWIAYKVPDGLPDSDAIYIYNAIEGMERNYGYSLPAISGGAESVAWQDAVRNIMLKTGEKWTLVNPISGTETAPAPQNIWGGLSCRPIVADFDGNDIDERAVMCPNEWRIAYQEDYSSKSIDGARYIPLGYDTKKFSLPGRPYSGGISYAKVWELIEYFQELNPTTPPPIPIDMATITSY